jgi:Protein of unknown function (DUF1656)
LVGRGPSPESEGRRIPPSFDVESKSRAALRSNYGGQAVWVLVRRGSTTNHFSLAKSLDLFHEPVDVIDINPMTLFALALNRPELQLGEVLIPWVVVVGTFGFLAAWLVVAIMERTGLSRYVWHLPLFFLALVVLLSSVIGVFFQP